MSGMPSKYVFHLFLCYQPSCIHPLKRKLGMTDDLHWVSLHFLLQTRTGKETETTHKLFLVSVDLSAFFYLQYSSKILKHLCLFPLPQCWFGYHSGLSASKYAWLNIGEGEGTFQGGKQCEVFSGKFERNRVCFNDLWRVLSLHLKGVDG